MKSKKKPQQRTRGRPTKCHDEDKIERFCKALSDGASLESACTIGGFHYTSLRNWINAAEAGDEKYLHILDKYKKATAECEHSLIAEIRTAARTQWQAGAWILERKYPEKYGRRNVVDLNAQQTVTVDDPQKIVNSLSPQQLSQMVSAIEARTLELAAAQNSEPQVKD